MKVIENNYKQAFPKPVTCEHCGSLIDLENEKELRDVEVKGFDPRDGEPYFHKVPGFLCPCCRKESRI